MLNLKSAALIAALLLCAACSSAVTPTPTRSAPTPIPSATLALSTYSGPLIRATLPPTWTPTLTLTNTLTWTPTPITPTATLTPIPPLADLCASVTVNDYFPDGHTFGWNDVITMEFGTTLTSVLDPATQKPITLTVRFLATQKGSGKNLGAQLQGGQVAAVELPINQLPGPGAYSWEVYVSGDGISDQCAHQGTFFVRQTAQDLQTATSISLTQTAMPTPTAQATDDSTDQIPMIQ